MNTYLANTSDFYLHYGLAILGLACCLAIIKWGHVWVGKYVCAGLIVSLVAAFYEFTLVFILPIAAFTIASTWVFIEFKAQKGANFPLKDALLCIGRMQRILGSISMLYLATIGIPSMVDNYYSAKYHEEETLKWELEKKLEHAFSQSPTHKKFMSFEEWEAQKANKRDTQ